ncbi:hypothetical protein BJ165DRAFT_857401 [Panaeolus papilionaceus]|nr:hypothetical protein BJ165DRAFT_857401 [Panaeolus papilionaceus]
MSCSDSHSTNREKDEEHHMRSDESIDEVTQENDQIRSSSSEASVTKGKFSLTLQDPENLVAHLEGPVIKGEDVERVEGTIISSNLTSEADFPDGGLRAWLIVCGVSVPQHKDTHSQSSSMLSEHWRLCALSLFGMLLWQSANNVALVRV